MPLVKIFCNPGLKERHWQEISSVISYPIDPNKEIQLNTLISLNVAEFLEKLEEIADVASKQYNIEIILEKMYSDWRPVECDIKLFKDTGTFVLGGNSVDEINQLLDDHIVKTTTMKGSSNAKVFEQRINEWEGWLTYTLQLVEYWIKVQQVWMYLEPIFSSPDIIKHLAQATSKFKEVDINWRSMMGKLNSNKLILEFTKNRKYLDILKESHTHLEYVQKELNSYLDGKRASFPRFYFLSSDELLEILSETKDPLKVQPHLKKCFEGI